MRKPSIATRRAITSAWCPASRSRFIVINILKVWCDIHIPGRVTIANVCERERDRKGESKRESERATERESERARERERASERASERETERRLTCSSGLGLGAITCSSLDFEGALSGDDAPHAHLQGGGVS